MHFIQRRELTFLQEWANQAKRKPIVLRGARQVGKSTLIRLLATNLNFALCEINFEVNPEYAELFHSYEPTEIIALLQIQLKTEILPGRTLLFLDEIQLVPTVIQALRYFYEKMPNLHVIAAGSLLEFTLQNMPISTPVGRIEYIHLGPINFEDFLIASKETAVVEFIRNFKITDNIPVVLHKKLIKLLKVYFIIGGMPEAVADYLEHNDFNAAERVKQAILNTYKNDFSKYAKQNLQDHLRLIFRKVPRLIGNKFMYSHIDKDTKTATIALALEKLCLARIVHKIYHTASNGIPLGAEINEKIFKIIFMDIGLLASSLDLNFNELIEVAELTMVNAGAVAEQFVGQHLLYNKPIYIEPCLYYWVREKKSASSELDYVINIGQTILPIEVKAGKTGTLKSLHYFMQEKHLPLAIRFNTDQPSLCEINNYKLLSLPMYLIEQLLRIVKEIS